MAVSAPVFDDVTLPQMMADPYPTYARLREEAPVAWLAPARIHLVTRYDDIVRIELDHETFPALDTRSLQIRAMGHSLMRRDGAEHARQRRALMPTFAGKTVNAHWGPIFEAIADEMIDALADRGRADLFDDFAAPYASRCLAQILGLPDLAWQTLCDWSQSMMDATGNYGDDPEIWAKGRAAYDGVNDAIDARLDHLRKNPDPSAIASMLHARDPLDLEEIRANTKVIIGGGLNEPRDAILSAVLGLLSNPDQLAMVQAEPALWATVFEETIRWITPIGLYPRTVSRTVEIGGAVLEQGDQIGLSVASACHDEGHFTHGARFDITRPKTSHLAFGAGPHFCAGSWIARKQVGELAVPKLFKRLRNLRLDPDRPPRVQGWVFRGPTSLPVLWDA